MDAEAALRSTSRGFRGHFERLEATLRKQGRELPGMTTAEKLALWQQAKGMADRE